MKYRIFLSPHAARFFRKIPPDVVKRIDKALLFLSDGDIKTNILRLTGDGLLRRRVGNYRIIFEIDSKRHIIVVHRIGHRKDIYRS